MWAPNSRGIKKHCPEAEASAEGVVAAAEEEVVEAAIRPRKRKNRSDARRAQQLQQIALGEQDGWASLFTDENFRAAALSQAELIRIQNPAVDWLNKLFPQIPSPNTAPRQPPAAWPQEVKDVVDSLLENERRIDERLGTEQGLRITLRQESFDYRSGEKAAQNDRLTLYAPDRWLTRDSGAGQATTIQWSDAQERGAINGAFLLGRLRPAVEADRSPIELRLDRSSLPVGDYYASYEPSIVRQSGGRILLTLRNIANPSVEIRYFIDSDRSVLLSVENRTDGRTTARVVFSDFFAIGGAMWPRKMERLNEQGKSVSVLTQTIAVLDRNALAGQYGDALAIRDQVQFVSPALPIVREAKQHVADGDDSFDDRLTLMLYFAATQQWDLVGEHLAAAEKLAEGKPGVRWLRNEYLLSARQREVLQERILAEAADLVLRDSQPAAPQRSESLFLSNHMLQLASGVLENNEMLALLDALRPVHEIQPVYTLAMKSWRERQAAYVQQTGRVDEALALWKALAVDFPSDVNSQQQYAQSLVALGRTPAAYQWLSDVLGSNVEWSEYEEYLLRTRYADLLATKAATRIWSSSSRPGLLATRARIRSTPNCLARWSSATR